MASIRIGGNLPSKNFISVFIQTIEPWSWKLSRAQPTRARMSTCITEWSFRAVQRDTCRQWVILFSNRDLGEFVGFLIDVTERRRTDEERERLRQVQADLAHV